MGVPMVQKQSRRKSSLIMGAVLALLLGVAAGFFVLAMPTHLLETVTTLTRLSKLMTQAEPPIMPYDKTVLAVLAGTLTAGIGWVAIDWLLFGRAGMRTLIREREDDYEESGGDTFRPTDPLDLVAPVSLPTGDWASPAASDPRRPLSARTDIGDPPLSTIPQGQQPIAMPGIDQLLPPIDLTPPGSLPAAPAFPSPTPLQAAPPLDPFQQPRAEPQPGNMFGNPDMPLAGNPASPSWAQAETSAQQQPQSAAPTRAWLPTPGVRPDGSSSHIEHSPALSDEDDDDALDLTSSQTVHPAPSSAPDVFGHTPPPLQLNTPQPDPAFTPAASTPDIVPQPGAHAPAPPPIMPTFPPMAPMQPPVPPPLAVEPPAFPIPQPPAFEPPTPPFAIPSAFQPAATAAPQPPAFDPPAPPFVQAPVFVPPAPPAAAQPAPPVAAPPHPAPRRASPDTTFAGLDRGRLEDLLLRLERGLEARRAAAARAAAAPPAAPVSVTQPPATPPAQPDLGTQRPAAAPQPAFAPLQAQAPAIHHAPVNVDPGWPAVPPAGFAAPSPGISQPVAPTTAPVYDLPTMPLSPAYNLAPIQAAPEAFAREPMAVPDEPTSDALLDQPLHVTLDLLRSKVRR